MKHLGVFAGWMLVVCVPPLLGQARPWDSAAEHRLAPHLAAAGIDRDDERAMIRAAHNENLSIRAAALFGLRYLPVSPAIIQELRLATNSENETILAYASDTLAEVGDRGWTESVLPRLPSIRSNAMLLNLCGALARSGEYGGWSYVKAALIDEEDGMARQGMAQVWWFGSMRDAAGRPVDVVDEVGKLSQSMPAERRQWIQGLMNQQINYLRRETVPGK
jgi:hypothetical protein